MNDPSVELDCPPDHDYCNSTEPAALDMSLDHNEELSVEIARLRNQIEEITISSKFCLERFAGSDDDIRFFTRFASHAHLMAFCKQIEPATCKIIRVTRVRSVAKTDEVPHTGNATGLWVFGWMRRLSNLTCQRFSRVTLTHKLFWTVPKYAAKHLVLFSSRVRCSRTIVMAEPAKKKQKARKALSEEQRKRKRQADRARSQTQ
ncbi:unnamed protein product, partial [Coregonus sp. 'balchen']